MPVEAVVRFTLVTPETRCVLSGAVSQESLSRAAQDTEVKNGAKDSGKRCKYKNQMVQRLYFALADDRSEAVLFSLLGLFPIPKAALVCLPRRDPRPYRV